MWRTGRHLTLMDMVHWAYDGGYAAVEPFDYRACTLLVKARTALQSNDGCQLSCILMQCTGKYS